MKYVLRRLLFYVIAAWASVTLAFFIPRMMPGDPTSTMFARFKGKLDPAALDDLRAAFGFTDGTLLEQYGVYLGNVLRGELGISIEYYPATVSSVIGNALVWTLVLAGVAVVISFTLGTLGGVLAAWRRGGWLDSTLPPLFVLLGAFPYFWLAMALLFVLGFQLELFPLGHAYDDRIAPEASWAFFSSVVGHAVLPAATIVLATMGAWMLDMRNTMIAVMGEDYIKLAVAKGLSPRRVMLRYAARNALLPNVTSFGMALGFVVSGSILTEIVFSYPGQGYLLLQAVQSQDYPLMQGLFLTITLAVLGANLLVDVAYAWLDPRTRQG
ncbi:putative oligopeptide/dipeptide ABC transporter, permease protein [Plesiocystis pacifica SIR-1]|uniref:Putative oligopeptide/dipeptide ABC transporter, permease protein n=1 Tax=Plesiocystis pacifica SIR-1 TaxID=391625 RepID=A6FX42_9BACT|nr:ABC transporter permease [Plesiocystis pacifica]EDM81866.1 putative oligopeptide/dipeptide ABC transporter, permease protein [Plesiocystis pacifica SIR-1]